MQHKALIAPVLTYLFHRLEARFDGRPTLLILDEAWIFLDDALFAARIREWLKTLRKKNVAVVFATQSLADIERSTIAPALIESCPTRIFLPNDRALEPQARARLRALRSQRAPDRDPAASPRRSATTTPRPRAATACSSWGSGRWRSPCAAPPRPTISGSSIDAWQSDGSTGFAARFLEAKGLAWAAELIERWPRPRKRRHRSPQASTPIDPAEGVPPASATPGQPGAPSPKAAARADAPRTNAPPLPGLPGGPPMPERLSPFRVTPGKSKRSGR